MHRSNASRPYHSGRFLLRALVLLHILFSSCIPTPSPRSLAPQNYRYLSRLCFQLIAALKFLAPVDLRRLTLPAFLVLSVTADHFQNFSELHYGGNGSPSSSASGPLPAHAFLRVRDPFLLCRRTLDLSGFDVNLVRYALLIGSKKISCYRSEKRILCRALTCSARRWCETNDTLYFSRGRFRTLGIRSSKSFS